MRSVVSTRKASALGFRVQLRRGMEWSFVYSKLISSLNRSIFSVISKSAGSRVFI